MKNRKFYLALLVFCVLNTRLISQEKENPLKIFGYFQNTFLHETEASQAFQDNSFVLQQLNMFFQKDIDTNWRAFVNLEFLNNFSSSRRWGAANLEEAWLRYRKNASFNLKFGLLLPTFNNLNEIKNRTPLLPYIIRPVVYETSFGEFFSIEEFTPGRAFIQAYGFASLSDNTKFDYALYLGNSPNINSDPDRGQTGVDTTDTFLVGGRIGLRYKDLKFGFSLSRDNDSQFIKLVAPVDTFNLGGDFSRFLEVPRLRIGNDFQLNYDRFSVEGETIIYRLANESEADFERFFYYVTLGYQHTEQLFAYISYWYAIEKFQLFEQDVQRVRFRIPTLGIAYYLNERIRLKAQYATALVNFDINLPASAEPFNEDHNTKFYAIAASVFF
jgi:hypothetical protein